MRDAALCLSAGRTEKHSLKVHEDPLFGTLKNVKTKKQQEFGKVTKLNSIEDTLKVMEYWEEAPVEAQPR